MTSLLLIVAPNCFALRCLLRHRICSTDFWCMHGSLHFPFLQKHLHFTKKKLVQIKKKITIVDILIAIWTLLRLLISKMKESWVILDSGGDPLNPPFARVAPLHPACGQLYNSKMYINLFVLSRKKKLSKKILPQNQHAYSHYDLNNIDTL